MFCWGFPLRSKVSTVKHSSISVVAFKKVFKTACVDIKGQNPNPFCFKVICASLDSQGSQLYFWWRQSDRFNPIYIFHIHQVGVRASLSDTQQHMHIVRGQIYLSQTSLHILVFLKHCCLSPWLLTVSVVLIIVTVKRSRGAFVFLVLHRHVSSNVRLTLNSWILMPSVCFCSSSCFFTSSSRSFSFCHSDFSLNQKKKTIEF